MANRSQFNRAIFEWCGMGTLAASLFCLGYWAASLISHRLDSSMSFRDLGLDASIANGAVTVSWTSRISLLIPALGFGLLAVICIWFWLRTVRRLAQIPKPDSLADPNRTTRDRD